MLAFWAEDRTFAASVDQRAAGEDGALEYVFYDGPPFANGLPHYGNLLTGYVKDAVPRYQTMRGYRVERRFGWDCHGLPAEMEAERELGISGHAAIHQLGIARFNEYCRTSVLRYTSEWRRYVTRQARWVDLENDYKTMDLDFMETTLWVFKQLYDRGLVYEGFRVLPYCYECETPLSNFETRFDDSTREREDPAVTVLFALDPMPADPGPTRLLVWTTTPWTLPSNLALAVNPDLEYAVFSEHGTRYVLGAARVDEYAPQLANAERVETIRGSTLVGRTYTPLLPFFTATPNAFQVLGADIVTEAEGTGILHVAPGFGEDDQRLGESVGIPVVCPVDDQGRFTAEVPTYHGQHVFDANSAITRDLKAAGSLVRQETYAHNYPHCWRSRNPLIYRAVSSWFVRVSSLRPQMLELNSQIEWIPAHIRDGLFANWLENARDWSVSRTRFWGAPIPIWRSDDPAYPRVDVYGSLDELERDFGVRPTDLHRPGIDELTRPNPDDPTGRSTMRRVPEVLDCWFESGAMPMGQVHYPFENAEWFENHFPADFIVEYIPQYRAWFFYLLVMSTALFDRPPFRRCVAHGIVLGNDGRKMSKSLGNSPDPDAAFGTYGSDALRWLLLSSPVLRGGDVLVEDRAIAEVVRTVLNPLWSAWHFFTLYARTDDIRATWRTDASGVLDRYLLGKARQLVESTTAQMDAADLSGACASISSFLDAMNNWYIRRSRSRFWRAGEDSDKTDAFDTLSTVLEVACRVAAPLLPLVGESIWRGLTGERSVHLTDWPDAGSLPRDDGLVADMDLVREVCSAARSLRRSHGLRIRLPLPSLTVAAPDASRLARYRDLITDEVNVKDLVLTDAVDSVAERVLQVVPAAIGPRLGPRTQSVLAAAREGSYTIGNDGTVEVAGETLSGDEFAIRLVPKDEHNARVLGSGRAVVVLDPAVTADLEEEGLARDVVRAANVARREAGLDVADRIHLWVQGPQPIAHAVERHRAYIAAETLAVSLELGSGSEDAFSHEAKIDETAVTIRLKRSA